MTTSPYTFVDLSSTETQSVIRARIVAALQAAGQPVASWAPSSAGGTENTRLDMVAGGLAQFMAKRYAAAVRGQVLPLASDDPETGYFLTYLGRERYQLPIQGATSTIKSIIITAGSGATTADYKAGDLWVRAPATGNRYRLSLPDGVTVHVQPGAIVAVPFQAENPGSSYADPDGTVTQLVTAKAGLTVVDGPAQPFVQTVRNANNSSGSILGVVDPAHKPNYGVVRVRIDLTGNVGGGGFSWSTDGGFMWTNGGAIPRQFLVPGGGILNFSNGGPSNSFVAGTIFSLIVNTSFVQRGRDAESPDQYRGWCSARWPALSLPPTKSLVRLWARQASSEVTKVGVWADPNIPGGILVTVSSQTGPASPGAQLQVEQYIQARLSFRAMPAPATPAVPNSPSPQETVMATSATKFPVTTVATIYVPTALMDAVQAGADEQWDSYVDGLPMGGQVGATVKAESFYTILGDLGAVDVQGLTFNGASGDLLIPNQNDATPADGSTLITSCVWVPV